MYRSSDSSLISSEFRNLHSLKNSASVSELVTRNNTSMAALTKRVHSISYKTKNRTTDKQAVSSETTMTTEQTDTTSATVTVTVSDTDATSATMATTSSDTIRVEHIKNLYDSEMIRSHGVKLQWVRNRMTA